MASTLPPGLQQQVERITPGQNWSAQDNKSRGSADLLAMAQQAQRIGNETATHLLTASQYPGTEAAKAHLQMAYRAQQSMLQVIEAELKNLNREEQGG